MDETEVHGSNPYMSDVSEHIGIHNRTAIATEMYETEDEEPTFEKSGTTTSNREDGNIKLKWITGAFALLSVCLVSLLYCIFHYMLKDERYVHKYIDNDFETICVLCDTILLSPDIIDLIKEFDGPLYKKDGVDICCTKNASQVVEMAAEKMARLKYASDNGTICGNSTSGGNASTAFTRLSRNHQYNSNESKPILFWDKYPNHYHISPDMTYHNGKIQIKRPGYYYVYCSIAYWEISSSMNKTFRSGRFSHWVYKYDPNHGPGGEKLVLENTDMTCESEIGITTSHVGLTLYLDAEEYLYVKVSETRRLARESLGNAFGIFRI